MDPAHNTDRDTDLTRLDAFLAAAGIETRELNIGGFLPAVQVRSKTHYVTFYFDDDGSFGSVGVVPIGDSDANDD